MKRLVRFCLTKREQMFGAPNHNTFVSERRCPRCRHDRLWYWVTR